MAGWWPGQASLGRRGCRTQGGFPSTAAEECSGPQADGLQRAHDPVELAHVPVPVSAERGLLRRELRGDGLAVDLAGPEVVGAMQRRGVGLAAARRLAAARHAPGDGPAQHEAESGQLGEQGAVAVLETPQRGIGGGGAFLS